MLFRSWTQNEKDLDKMPQDLRPVFTPANLDIVACMEALSLTAADISAALHAYKQELACRTPQRDKSNLLGSPSPTPSEDLWSPWPPTPAMQRLLGMNNIFASDYR